MGVQSTWPPEEAPCVHGQARLWAGRAEGHPRQGTRPRAPRTWQASHEGFLPPVGAELLRARPGTVLPLSSLVSGACDPQPQRVSRGLTARSSEVVSGSNSAPLL